MLVVELFDCLLINETVDFLMAGGVEPPSNMCRRLECEDVALPAAPFVERADCSEKKPNDCWRGEASGGS